jgi:tRNA threonylcarbamoyladenosine biosynthesis protein TsaB
MKLLLLDTSTAVCSVAVVDGSRILAETVLNLPGSASSRLSEEIERLILITGLHVNQLDGFGVATGPGAFTSLRVGLATVKGLALATDKPVAAFSSLALLAANLPWAPMPVCPMFDARKGEVYAGLYRASLLPELLRPDTVAVPADFLGTLTERTLFVGDGAVRYRELITEMLGERACFCPLWANLPRAVAATSLVTSLITHGKGITAGDLLPTYLRRSEAENSRLAVLPSSL